MKTWTSIINRAKVYNSEDAYNLWSQCYDDESDNLMLYYDEIILNSLIAKINLTGKTILDYGCGTGRNWNNLLEHRPAKIIGCDISPGMLSKLKLKFENAETYLIDDTGMSFLEDHQCDVIISTLVIAHIKNIGKLFHDWKRVLKPHGKIIMTDFHPDLLAAGGSRTFRHNNKSISIKNYVHRIKNIENEFASLGFRKLELIEVNIDENVKHFYEKHNAFNVYEKYKGTPFIYGILFSGQYAD